MKSNTQSLWDKRLLFLLKIIEETAAPISFHTEYKQRNTDNDWQARRCCSATFGSNSSRKWWLQVGENGQWNKMSGAIPRRPESGR